MNKKSTIAIALLAVVALVMVLSFHSDSSQFIKKHKMITSHKGENRYSGFDAGSPCKSTCETAKGGWCGPYWTSRYYCCEAVINKE
jgi:hypothetical protein